VDGLAIDWPLAEIKILRSYRAHSEIRPGSAEYDGQFEVPALQEATAKAKKY